MKLFLCFVNTMCTTHFTEQHKLALTDTTKKAKWTLGKPKTAYLFFSTQSSLDFTEDGPKQSEWQSSGPTNCTSLGIVNNHAHPFMTMPCPSSDGKSQCSRHFKRLTRLQFSRAPLGCGEAGNLYHVCAANGKKNGGTSLVSCWIDIIKNYCSSESKKGVWLGTSVMCKLALVKTACHWRPLVMHPKIGLMGVLHKRFMMNDFIKH